MSSPITDPEQLKELLGIPFTPEQTACITAPPAPQVIVAGAGSGKTTVMAARVVWLVGTGQVAPEQVLGLTFTNKAAGELSERVRKALVAAGVTDPDVIDPDNPPGEPSISTYHAFAGRLLTEHGLRIGLEPTTRLLADATRYQLAARVLREAPGPYPALTRSFPTLVSDLLALDAELAEHLVRPEQLAEHDTELLRTLASARLTNAELRKIPETAEARRELLSLTRRYRDAKRSRDLLDFGDQIALSAELALTRPEVGAILRDEYRVVLLDEYQDTSVAQRLLLSALFGGGPDGTATGHAVTAVGDPCQAIYGWRGASVANLDDFPRHFPHADGTPATRYSLSENRRSGGRLLHLANGLAEPLRAMHEGVEALRPAPGAERDGIVRCALLRTHTEEIDWLADSIAHLVRTGKAPGEIAVLCRTAGDFPEIQAALVARDIPVEVVGLSGLLHLPEVADLVAVCEVLQDPGANASLVRLLTGPRWRIGPRDLALLGRRARLLVHHAAHADDEDFDPDRRLAEAVEGIDPAEVISLADALDTFLESSGTQDDGLPFSTDARIRFARLATELRDLRRSLADPSWTSCTASSPPPASTSNSPRRRRRWPPAAGRPSPTSWTWRPVSPPSRARPRSWPSSAFCAPPSSTRRAWTTRCPAARTPSRSSPPTSPRAWSGTSSPCPAWSPASSPVASPATPGRPSPRFSRTRCVATRPRSPSSTPGTPRGSRASRRR